jgi:hypothetical protein
MEQGMLNDEGSVLCDSGFPVRPGHPGGLVFLLYLVI